MLHILTGSFASSVRFYASAEEEGSRAIPAGRRVEAPTGFAAHPDPVFPSLPRERIERGYHLARWREMREGGHFAAMEVPDDFVADVRESGHDVRGSA